MEDTYAPTHQRHGAMIDAGDAAAPPLFASDPLPVQFESPWDVKEIALDLPGIPLVRPGQYLWQVMFGSEVLHERRWSVAHGGG